MQKNGSPNNRKTDFTLFPSKSETSPHKGTLQLAVQSYVEQSTSILRGFIHITSHRSKTIATKQEPSRLMPPRLSLLDFEPPKITVSMAWAPLCARFEPSPNRPTGPVQWDTALDWGITSANCQLLAQKSQWAVLDYKVAFLCCWVVRSCTE